MLLSQGTCGRIVCGDTFGCQSWAGRRYWHLAGGGRGCCCASHGAQGSPPRPGVCHLTPHAQSAEAEAPWARFLVCRSGSGFEALLSFCFRFYSWGPGARGVFLRLYPTSPRVWPLCHHLGSGCEASPRAGGPCLRLTLVGSSSRGGIGGHLGVRPPASLPSFPEGVAVVALPWPQE